MAGTRPAEFFRDRDAEKTHLGEALPQLLVVRSLAVEHDSHRLGRALFSEEFARLVAELLLVVGEIEVHGGLPCYSFIVIETVIPGRDEVASPESIPPRPCDPMDSGFTLRAPRNDGMRELCTHRSTITSSSGSSA